MHVILHICGLNIMQSGLQKLISISSTIDQPNLFSENQMLNISKWVDWSILPSNFNAIKEN